MFPKLDKHCPFKAQLAEAMDGDLCTICSHQVHDLDAMTPEARRAFLKGGSEPDTVCVRYRMPAALAAAALAASVTALPALAQDAPSQEQESQESVEIVGSFVRLDPCRIVQTVRGRQIADVQRCADDRYWEKTSERAPRTR